MNIIFALISAVFVGTRRLAAPRTGLRHGERTYYRVRKEMGIDPYSPAELGWMEAEEAATRADFHEGAGFWIDQR